MSKIGQYIVDDDAYWQDHEFDVSYESEYEPEFINTYTDCTTLPPDVKQRLINAGLDEWYVLDDIPF